MRRCLSALLLVVVAVVLGCESLPTQPEVGTVVYFWADGTTFPMPLPAGVATFEPKPWQLKGAGQPYRQIVLGKRLVFDREPKLGEFRLETMWSPGFIPRQAQAQGDSIVWLTWDVR